MKKYFFLFLILLIFSSCISSNFSLTENEYESLSEDYPVKIVLTESFENFEYDEIGILQIIQEDIDDFSKVLESAKNEARLKGGDIIFLISSDSNMSVFGTSYGIFSSESNSYFICRRTAQEINCI